MKNLVLLNKEQSEEVANLFNEAGYHVTQIEGLKRCSHYLLQQFETPHAMQMSAPYPVGAQNDEQYGKGITILTADEIDPQHEQKTTLTGLPAMIVSLARRLTPGWHLNLRRRTLQSPNHAEVKLTSLEFVFIKIFALVDSGESVSRRKIVQEFGEDYLCYDQNRLDTLVRRLRKKVEEDCGVRLPLNTVRVRGFAFDDNLIIDI